ncbi:MAG: hypothetical protein VX589_14560 [Myxococcota bacterium]|nr:hypothetical protein [Myxococcota bacterium]
MKQVPGLCLGLGLVGFFALSWGCTDSQDSVNADVQINIADQPIEGRIDGRPWRFESGLVDIEIVEEDLHYVHLFPSPDARCDAPPLHEPHIIVHVPKMEGEYAFGPALNATFAVMQDGQTTYEITFDGALVVAQLTDDSLLGALYARRGDAHEVNGLFSARSCRVEDDGAMP